MKSFTIPFFVCLLFIHQTVFGQTYVPKYDDTLMQVAPQIPIQAYAFGLGDVRLESSEFKKAMDADVAYLRFLEPDRLLSGFRSNAGLEPKGEKYGGWESEGLAGHSLGHFMTALAMHHAVSGDTSFLHKLDYIVSELAFIQQKRGTGYIGAIPREDSVFYQVMLGNIRSHGFDLNGAWSPWYTIHKIMAGLLDAYLYTGNQEALAIEIGMADWTAKVLRGMTYDEIQKMLRCEYGGMNEVLANTYAISGNPKYLELSRQFHDKFVMDSLRVEVNVLPGKHSNTQIPKVIGAARLYELTGKTEDLTTANFFWNTIVNHHTYAPGGNSNYEYLGPEDQLNNQLTDNTMETCNTHNMLKLTSHLFSLSPDSKLMDYYERGLYNHILASQNRANGMVCYFVPLRMGTRKEFSTMENDFTCCLGTGMENHVKYGDNIFSRGVDGSLYVNLFIPSTLSWKEKDSEIKVESDFPTDNKVSVRVNPRKPQQLVLRIRKPAWSGKEVDFQVNGRNVEVVLEETGYYRLERKWKKGDLLTVQFDLNLYSMSMPDNESRKAFFYGPIMLAGDLGSTEPEPQKGIPVILSEDKKAENILTQEGDQFVAKVQGEIDQVTFRPFYDFDENFYSVYWDVFNAEEWENQQSNYELQKQRDAELASRTIDVLRIGEMQPERDHNLKGEDTFVGESHTRKFRSTSPGGHFSFDMRIAPEEENQLLLTFWGMDNRGRRFDIIINGVKVANVDINSLHDSKFYELGYDVPSHLTRSKSRVNVLLKAEPGMEAGPIYGVKMVKRKK